MNALSAIDSLLTVRPLSAAGVLSATNPDAVAQAEQAASSRSLARVVSPSEATVDNSIGTAAAVADPMRATLRTAVASLDGLAPLMADLVQAQQTPGLPESVQTAIAQILDLRHPIGLELTGPDIKAALVASGLFSDANAAEGLQEPVAGAPAIPERPDIKTALLVLQQVLKTSLAFAPAQPDAPLDAPADVQEAKPAPVRSPSNGPTPPPYRGGPTSAQPSLLPASSIDAAPHLVGAVLTSGIDAALSHMKLLQIASLPDAPQDVPRNEDQGSRWMFEIPFATAEGSAVAQFEISRDPKGGAADPSEPVWRARFSLDVEPMGPVHVQVALMGERAWVTLWAEREASVQTLRANEALLSQGLKDSNLSAEIAFCFGTPHRPAAATGQFLDSAS